jgi:2-dehydro-3-deoxyphosphogluconate aldolase / (4S)-4-hydroxy-2-oxoglutarate aldolase
MTSPLETFAPNRVVAILRAPKADAFLRVSEVLYDAGFRCVEFTLTTEGALDALEQALASLPSDLAVGVGTVRTQEHVSAAIDRGAAFLVSQVFRPQLVQAAQARGVPFFPGALTPTEILDAWDSGVPAVKVSPIGPVGGLAYFDQLRGPLPDVPMMPTGGVELGEVSAYLDKGAAAVGLSGPLLGDSLDGDGDLAALAARAGAVIDAISG